MLLAGVPDPPLIAMGGGVDAEPAGRDGSIFEAVADGDRDRASRVGYGPSLASVE